MALNVSLVDMILVVLTISLTVFPLFILFYFVCIYIYKIIINPETVYRY